MFVSEFIDWSGFCAILARFAQKVSVHLHPYTKLGLPVAKLMENISLKANLSQPAHKSLNSYFNNYQLVRFVISPNTKMKEA